MEERTAFDHGREWASGALRTGRYIDVDHEGRNGTSATREE